MRWLRAHPSMAAVLAIDLGWLLIALASSEARPLGPSVWSGEDSLVEWLEVALVVGCAAAWLWIGWRLRGRPRSTLPRILAASMVVQLVFMLSEEMDWCFALGLPHRNIRQATRGWVPDILDTPVLAGYLLWFLFSPLLPLAAVRSWLERAAPVRAEKADAWAAIAGTGGSVLVWMVVGDQELGELQQLVVYAVLVVITLRIARESGPA